MPSLLEPIYKTMFTIKMTNLLYGSFHTVQTSTFKWPIVQLLQSEIIYKKAKYAIYDKCLKI